MIVVVEVDVATARPPRVHATLETRIEVPLPDDDGTIAGLNRAMHQAELEAELTAIAMAQCHPHVVMVLAARTTEIEEI